MDYFVYVLESQVDGSLYIGSTSQVQSRLVRHNSGRSRYTARKMPWKLMIEIPCQGKSEALELEKRLKSWKNPARVRVYIAKILASHVGGCPDF